MACQSLRSILDASASRGRGRAIEHRPSQPLAPQLACPAVAEQHESSSPRAWAHNINLPLLETESAALPSPAGASDPRDFDEYVIVQHYDAKILTALLAVGDCIYFDLGTPECVWQRPSRSELPQCIGSRQPPVARIRTEALLASSANNPASAKVHADGKSAP